VSGSPFNRYLNAVRQGVGLAGQAFKGTVDISAGREGRGGMRLWSLN